MKQAILLLLLGVTLFRCQAESYPVEVQSILEESPVSLSEFLKMDVKNLIERVTTPFMEGVRWPARLAVRSAAYLLLAALVMSLLTGSAYRQEIETVATFGFAALCAEPLSQLNLQIVQIAQSWHTYLCGFIPVFSGVLTAQGRPTMAAVYDGLFIGLSAMAVHGIGTLFLPFVQGYVCLSIAAQLWGNPGAAEGAALLYRCSSWLLKLVTAMMTALFCLQGSLAGLADEAASKGLTTAAKLVLPVVGSLAAQAAGSVAAGLRLLKGALAFGAVLYVGASFLPAFGRCAALLLIFWGMAVGAKALGLSRCGAMAEHFGNGVQLCASVLTCYFFLVIFSTMLMALAGGG